MELILCQKCMQLQFSVLPSASRRQFHSRHMHSVFVIPSAFSFPQSIVFSSTVSIQFSSVNSFQFDCQHSVFSSTVSIQLSSVNSFQFDRQHSVFHSQQFNCFPRPIVFSLIVSIQSTVFSSTVSIQFSLASNSNIS